MQKDVVIIESEQLEEGLDRVKRSIKNMTGISDDYSYVNERIIISIEVYPSRY